MNTKSCVMSLALLCAISLAPAAQSEGDEGCDLERDGVRCLLSQCGVRLYTSVDISDVCDAIRDAEVPEGCKLVSLAADISDLCSAIYDAEVPQDCMPNLDVAADISQICETIWGTRPPPLPTTPEDCLNGGGEPSTLSGPCTTVRIYRDTVTGAGWENSTVECRTVVDFPLQCTGRISPAVGK